MKAKTLAAMLLVGLMLGSVLVVMPGTEADTVVPGKFFFGNEGGADETGTMFTYNLKKESPTGEDKFAKCTISSAASFPTVFKITLDKPLAITSACNVTFWFRANVPLVSASGVIVPGTLQPSQFSVSLGNPNQGAPEGRYRCSDPSENLMVPGTIYQRTVTIEGAKGLEYEEGGSFEVWIYAYFTVVNQKDAPQATLEYVVDSAEHPSQIVGGGLPLDYLAGGAAGAVKLLCEENAKNARPGDTVSYDITMNNEGTASETVDLAVYNAPEGWTATLDKSQVTVAGGASESAVLTVKAASDAEVGSKINITVTGTYSGGGVASVVTTTTVVSADTKTYGAELSASPTSGEADKGKQTTYTITVKNKGSAQDTITLAVVSEKGWDVSLDKQSLTLAAGATGTATLTVKVPTTAIEGDKDTATITATCGDGTTKVTKAVQTTVKAGAGSSGDGAKKGFIPGFEIIALIGGLGIAAIIAKSGNKKKW